MVRLLACAAAAATVLFGLPSVARAATFTVNVTGSTYDGVCDAANCSLRDAIDVANKTPGADTIVLGPHAYGAITTWCTSGPKLDCGEMLITDDLTIQGAGAHLTNVGIPDNTVIPARIFNVAGITTKPRVKLLITGITVRKGGGVQIPGGGVAMTHAEVTIKNSIFDANTGSVGGAIAVQNDSLLVMDHSAVINSVSYLASGAIDNQGQTVRLTNVTLSNNISQGITGGAISNSGGLVFLNQVTAVGNSPGTIHSATNPNNSQAVIQIKNSVLANLANTNCTGTQFAQSIHLFQATYSAETGGSCGFGIDPAAAPHNKSEVPIDSLVSQLPVNATAASPITIHALVKNSPAIDTAETSSATPDDVLGKPRPVDGNGDGATGPDMGAFEVPAPSKGYIPMPHIPLPGPTARKI